MLLFSMNKLSQKSQFTTLTNHLKFIENNIFQRLYAYLIIIIIKSQSFCEEILQVFFCCCYHMKDFRTQLLILLTFAVLPSSKVWLKCSLILVLQPRTLLSALICKTKFHHTTTKRICQQWCRGKLLPC